MSAALAQPADAAAAEFRRRLALLVVNATAAPDLILHVAAHLLADPRAGSEALAALSRALTGACSTTEPQTLPGHAHAHCKRVAGILLTQAMRGDRQ